MTGYGFFASIRFLGFIGLVFVGSIIGFSYFIYSELATEARFRKTYGENWRVEYEDVRGPVARSQVKMAVAGGGVVAECALMLWLLRQIQPGALAGTNAGNRKRKHGHHRGSPLERAARQKRNAVLGIYFGLAGILAGVFLSIFRVGIFDDHANEVVLGIFVFLAGYCGVMAGCSSWLKAKNHSEGIVFIALMPLVVLFIPFVRLFLIAVPGLMALAMVMMPVILIVVVAVLPDQSGGSNRKHW